MEDLKIIFDNPDPVPADWEALRAKVLAKGYADYVPASALPAENVVQLPGVSTPAATEKPATDNPGPKKMALDQANPQNPAPEPPAPITAAAYLPDGSPNPAYVHPA